MCSGRSLKQRAPLLPSCPPIPTLPRSILTRECSPVLHQWCSAKMKSAHFRTLTLDLTAPVRHLESIEPASSPVQARLRFEARPPRWLQELCQSAPHERRTRED